MQTSRRDLFTTVRSEGAILPVDVLQRIAEGDSALDGLKPVDYHLLPNERLNEAINRAWNRLLGAWEAFKTQRDRLPTGDPGTSVTRERWLLPLFEELRYGRLQTARAVEIDGRSFPVSHGWGHAPIHLAGCNIDLDRRAAGVSGAARMSPHSMVQETLNRSSDNLWGFVSNGLRLRVLRDNASLTRQAFVEFDLESMMEGEVYADFVLLWLLCHQSRIESERPADCWLEIWSRAASEQGTRALDGLRNGVEDSISTLGRGFLAHSSNTVLREKLRGGELNRDDYYRQLLRTVYRLLFLFVAEDRDLLLRPDASEEARERYTRFYSTGRLRRIAERRRGTRHSDLWSGLALVFTMLGKDEGCPPLGLPALGSFLWSSEGAPDLDGCELANTDLLEALRNLAFIRDGARQRPVDYRNLGAEELGSVYESLLELHPVLNVDAREFRLASAGGSERKTTGSYYTPTSLITNLLDTALDPVLDDAVKQPDPEAAILDLKVCDPAAGSGHFLIAAAHRIAKRLASVRTGELEPAPEATRAALRDVIGRCIYGVDINPMAVELCKVSLWMEALEPGKPLSFLDHHIQTGNSLIGATPALLAAGVPDDAFKPIAGDDKAVASAIRKRNKKESTGQQSLGLRITILETLDDVKRYFSTLSSIEETVEDVRAKERAFGQYQRDKRYREARIESDLWTAAFFWPLYRGAPEPPTQSMVRKLMRDPNLLTYLTSKGRQQFESTPAYETVRLARSISNSVRAFHWQLAFPDVFIQPSSGKKPENEQAGWSGGFDVVIGNPPWEQTQLSEKEWFAVRHPEIANAAGAVRKRMINRLEHDDSALFRAFKEAVREADGWSHFVRSSDRYPLCGRGKINTYSIFAETNRLLLDSNGRVGCIVPSGIATDDTTKFFFQDLMESGSLASLYDFENAKGIFQGVHRSYKFCLLTMAGAARPPDRGAQFVFFAHDVADLQEEERRFTLTASDLALLNPNTRTCPIFRSRRDAELTKSIYRRVPVLIEEGPPEKNPWGISFRQGLFNMTSDSHLFHSREDLEARGYHLTSNIFTRGEDHYFPLYEAKMTWMYDHRAADVVLSATATVRQGQPDEIDDSEKVHPDRLSLPRSWIHEAEVRNRAASFTQSNWLVGFRDITSPTNERTVVSTLLPMVGVGHKMPLVFPNQDPLRVGGLYANLNCFCFDYVARQKVNSTSLSYFYFQQFPVLPPSEYAGSMTGGVPLASWINNRVVELTYTAWDIQPFAQDCGFDGPPFRWDEERRFLLRCELDAAYFHLYGIERDDVDYIMETFPIVKRKDERDHCEYRTKRVILEIYDAMADATLTGIPYQSRLDPPPADPSVAHPPRMSSHASE